MTTPLDATHAHAAPELPWTDRLPPEADVLIVGGGFGGLMTLVHLVASAPSARIVLVERRPNRTPGVAYGACDPVHLLNVPAGRMGAISADVGGFLAWLDRCLPGQFAAGTFAPRRLYGNYLLQLVHARLAEAWKRVCLVRDAVVHIDHVADGVELLMSSGRTCAAGYVVIAPGLPPARAPWALVAAKAPRRLLAADPWDVGAFEGVAPDATVLVVGSGLTAIDVVLALRSRGHAGHVVMVSKSGRLPLPHGEPGDAPQEFTRAELEGGPPAVLAVIRRAARERARRGQGWQAVVDALRPHTADVWRTWTTAQRQQFLRHARPYWETHRHRVPRQVLDVLEQLRAEGHLHIVRGQLTSLQGDASGQVRAEYSVHGGPPGSTVAARVFNCIGPATSVRHTADPLLRSLLDSGIAATDGAGLGLRADSSGNLLGADGSPDPRLYLVGALRRADAWESTAVPELRLQSERVAQSVAAALAGFGNRHASDDAAPLPVLEGCG